MMSSASLTRLTVLAGLMLVLLPGIGPASSHAADAPAALRDIRFSFKLDPRLSGPTYGGERWVSPPTYVGASAQDTVDARAEGVDGKGMPTKISPEWVPSDPEMVTVSPSQGQQVKITVKRAGESTLNVVSQGFSKALAVKAKYLGNAIQVEITPLAAGRSAAAAPAPEVPALKTPTEQASAPAGPTLGAGLWKPSLDKEKLSYALGMNFGNSLRKRSLEVDPDLVSQGLKDAVSGGKTRLTDEELRAVLVELQAELKSKPSALKAARMLPADELAERNKKGGEAFMAANKAKEGVVTLESGLQYKILKGGDGKRPTLDDLVVVHYRGTQLDGMEFTSTYNATKGKRKGPAGPVTFPVKGAFKGLTEALLLMPAGSKWQLFIPADLAYGEQGSRRKSISIGPNATLIFEVELISIKNISGHGAHAEDADDAEAQRDGDMVSR